VNLYLLLPLILSVVLVGSFSNSFAEVESVDVVENKLITLIGEGFDPDAEDLTFQWTQIYGDPMTLSSYTIPEPTFMAPDVENGEIKVLTFELLVTDPFGESSSDTVEIIVNSVNNPPVVNAGNDVFVIKSINAISIIPTASDKDDDMLTYKWKQLSGQEVNLSSITQKHLTLEPIYFDFSQNDPLTFQITVDDGFGGTASDQVNVILFSSGLINNDSISIDAGPIQIVNEGQNVTLDVTGKTLNDQPISYTWYQVIGTPVKLSSFNGDQVHFVAPEIGDNEELLSFHVTGYSAGLGWANDLALVKVIPTNGAPIADAGNDQNVSPSVFVNLEGTGSDPDGDNIRYMWSQKSGISVELYEHSQPSAYFVAPTIQSFSEPLEFELKVTDVYGNFDTDDTVVTVSTANSPPRAYAGPDKRVHGGDDVFILGTAVDLNSDNLQIVWKQISGDAVAFDESNLKLSFTAPEVTPTTFKRLAFELTVTDPEGLSDSDQVVIFVSPKNNAPRANAGPDMTVNENTVVQLQCTGIDPDGNKLDFTWSTSSNAVIEQNTSAQTLVIIPNVVSDLTITFTCTVDDGTFSSSDSMDILIKNTLSLDIVADAGDDRIVNESVKVSLDGSESHDPENQKLSYEWTQVSGETVNLSSISSVNPSFTSPIVNNNEIKVLTFDLKVFDDNGRKSIDSVVITVDPVNSPPEAFASAKQ